MTWKDGFIDEMAAFEKEAADNGWIWDEPKKAWTHPKHDPITRGRHDGGVISLFGERGSTLLVLIDKIDEGVFA